VLVVDLSMPGLNGLEVTRQINHRRLKTRVIVLSMHSNERYITDALKNGAFGYVFKNSPAEQLVRAIRDVAAGLHYLPPPFSEMAIDAFIENAKRAVGDSYESLTTREREVLQLAAEGNTAAEVGTRLFISPRTVEIHRASLMKKLSLRNQADLIRYALNKGFLPLDEPLNHQITGPKGKS
jgi:DNA-binding NarL/FixJ family response regulator